MRKRSDLYALMAKREQVRKAETIQSFRDLHNAQTQAEMMRVRLREILDERQVTGPVLAAELRSASSLNTKIAAEAAVQTERAAKLADEVESFRSEMAKQNHKTNYLLDAAKKAKRDEAEEAEALRLSAQPAPKR